MSEVDLAALAQLAEQNEKEKEKTQKRLTPMQEMNMALQECKFGRFHFRLLFSAMIAYFTGVLVSSSTAYLLSTAECDLSMNLVQKGFLNAAPYTGMIFSSIIAGFLTDTFGRKIFLMIGFGGIFLFTLISATSQSYEVLVTSKFCEGVLFATSFNPLVTLTSEFCHNGIRDRIMLLQSSFVSISQIGIALISWAILIQDWNYTLVEGHIELHTWNFYLYICSLFSLTTFLLYSIIPESPKFLLSINKYDEAREILVKIYKENTGKSRDTYPYKNIWRELSNEKDRNCEEKPSLSRQIITGLHNVKPIFKKPLVMMLMLICCMHFLSMLMYNVIRLWYPQLSTIIEHYSPGAGSEAQDLCSMLDTYTNDLKMSRRNTTDVDVCVPKKSGNETYINSIILGCICTLPYMVSGMLVNKVGKRNLLLACGIISFSCTLGLRWSSSKTMMVALFSIDVALTQTMTGLFQNVIVEYFPTLSRTLAVAIVMVSGRIGTLIGNIAFPILLDLSCVIPFFTLAGMMLCVTILAIFLPGKKT